MGCGASSGGGVPDVNVKKAASSADRFDANAGLADKSTDAALLSMHMLFAFYDTDASGSIDAKELLKMMTNVLKKAKDSGGADKKKKGPSGPWSKWEDDMLNNALAAANGEDSDMPTLRDVHEMMYAIGVEPVINELGQQAELTIEESIFIDWMLGGMKRTQAERSAFGSENDVQRKMVAFLNCLLQLVEQNTSGIKFMFSDKEDDDSPGGIDAEELFALMYKARATNSLRRVRRALLGIKDKKGKPPPMIDQDLVYRAVRQLDRKSTSGSRPILRERAFTSYMLMAFKQGAARRRQIFERDQVMVWMCAVLEFIKDTALPGMLTTERSNGGGNASDPMTSLALSSMVTEYDRDGDDKLSESEFRKLVRACTRKAGYRLEARDELSLSDFMSVFDQDNDGSIDHIEFIDFMSGLMKLDRSSIIAQGEFGMLQWYVVESAKLRVRFLSYAVTELSALVKAVRAAGSKNSSGGCVSASELTRLVQNCELALEAAKLKDILPDLHKKKKKDLEGDDDDVNAGTFKAKDAQKLINFMDKDGDGKLQVGEFVECIMRSILQSKKSTRSALKKARLSKALEGMITVLRTEVQRRVLVESSRMLFRKFDSQLVGEIDVNGLAKLLLACAKEHGMTPPWESSLDTGWKAEYENNVEKSMPWVQVLMDKMDVNKDGLLQEEEFCLYLGATLMREHFANVKKETEEIRGAESTDPDQNDREQKLKDVIAIVDCELPMLS